eukprot:492264_1
MSMLSFCSVSKIIITNLYALLCILMVITCVYVLYKFLQTLDLKKHCWNHILGIIFTFGTIFAISSSIITVAGDCYGVNQLYNNILDYSCISNLFIQSLLLIIIIFNKLYIVFENTQFKLGLYITSIYLFLIISLIISSTISICLYITNNNNNNNNTNAIVYWITFSILLFIICLISLNVIFIHKLISVYKDYKIDKSVSDYQILVTSMIQSTILVSVSVFILIIDITYTMSIRQPTIKIWIINIFSNFILIIMQYKTFKTYYFRYCSCIDSFCYGIWVKILENNPNKESLMNISDFNLDRMEIMDGGGSDSDNLPLPTLSLVPKTTTHRPTDSVPLIVYDLSHNVQNI